MMGISDAGQQPGGPQSLPVDKRDSDTGQETRKMAAAVMGVNNSSRLGRQRGIFGRGLLVANDKWWLLLILL